jgi:L-malate glycosyltransferase
MKLLVISHACATPINQQFFAEVEKQTNWQLCIVIPENWISEYGKTLRIDRWPAYHGDIIGLPVWKSGNIPLHFYQTTFISLLREFQPDVIYVNHEPYAASTFQVFLANHLSMRKPIGFFTWQNLFKRYITPFHYMERFVLKSSQFAFVGSYSAQEVLKRKDYAGKTVLLPSGIDEDVYFPHSNSNDELKNKLDIKENEILIGFLGRIVEEKGLQTLLMGLKQIQDLSWRLVVIGAGPFENKFDALARNLQLNDRIIRFDFVPHPEAPRYLSAFDILVLPSKTCSNWKEQFGRVIIEAMACGTPVVGSNSGEIPNLIGATQGGLIFPEEQPQQLAHQLKSLILDPSLRLRLGQQGRQNVLRDYINSTLAKRFAETIEKVVT